MNSAIEGGCLCGGLRYRLNQPPTGINDCHCLDCRRSSGAPYLTWGCVDRVQLVVQKGEARKISHAGRVRSFAACCGTQVFFEDDPDSETVDVTIASLDDPSPFAPEITIWTEDRLPWIPVEPNRPTFRRSAPDR